MPKHVGLHKNHTSPVLMLLVVINARCRRTFVRCAALRVCEACQLLEYILRVDGAHVDCDWIDARGCDGKTCRMRVRSL